MSIRGFLLTALALLIVFVGTPAKAMTVTASSNAMSANGPPPTDPFDEWCEHGEGSDVTESCRDWDIIVDPFSYLSIIGPRGAAPPAGCDPSGCLDVQLMLWGRANVPIIDATNVNLHIKAYAGSITYFGSDEEVITQSKLRGMGADIIFDDATISTTGREMYANLLPGGSITFINAATAPTGSALRFFGENEIFLEASLRQGPFDFSAIGLLSAENPGQIAEAPVPTGLVLVLSGFVALTAAQFARWRTLP